MSEYPLPERLRSLRPSSKQTKSGSAPTKLAPHIQPNTRLQWVQKFLAWLAERVLAPVLLTWFLVLVRASVIDNEKYMMQFDNNGNVNVLINGLSRAFFLGVRDFPGITDPNLWARLAAVVIDMLGAAFLWWMGGHWDPDIAYG